MWKTDSPRKQGKIRRFLVQGGLCLFTAVVVSAAYLVYMAFWTTRQVDFRNMYLEKAQENVELEESFRSWVTEKERLVALAGYEAKAQRIELLASLREEIGEEIALWNKDLAPPLEPQNLTLRGMIIELLRQKRDLELGMAAARAEVAAMKENFEIERSDMNLQSQIYLKKIERLEERLEQIEQR